MGDFSLAMIPSFKLDGSPLPCSRRSNRSIFFLKVCSEETTALDNSMIQVTKRHGSIHATA